MPDLFLSLPTLTYVSNKSRSFSVADFIVSAAQTIVPINPTFNRKIKLPN